MGSVKNKATLLREIRNFALVVLGAAVLGFGTGVFIVPFDLVTGGVSGLAIIIEKILPFSIHMDIYIAVLTWALFFLGLFTLGKNFALKTLVSSIVYPVAFALAELLVSPDVLGGFFHLQSSGYGDIAILLAALFGGICVGAGCAVTFIGGGSTGGVDVIAFLICKVFKRAKSSVVIFLVDAAVIVGGMFALGDLAISLLGICSAFICAMVIDYVFVGNSKAFIAHIISDRAKDINHAIIADMERTTTILTATGGYSGQNKTMLMVSFTIRQYSELLSIVNRIDKRAFVTISAAHEINGEGWTYNSPDEKK